MTSLVTFYVASAVAATKELKVRSYDLSTWGNSQTDSNITLMNSMASDASCSEAMFTRDGDVEEFDASLPAVLSSLEEMNMFAEDGASVYVVRAITHCGGASGTIAGCARKGGPIIVTTFRPRNQLWIHEIGHAQDRRHNPSTGFIMFRSLGAAHTKLTTAECTALKSPQLFPIEAGEEVSQSQDEAATVQSIDELLSGHWEVGLGDASVLADVQALSAEDVAVAMRTLSEADSSRWPNAVLIVGYHATPENRDKVFETFGSILATSSPEPSSPVEFAQRNVGIAVGFMLRQHGTNDAARYLVELARGSIDEAAGIDVITPDAMTSSLICASAVQGLALGGEAFAGQRREASSFCEQWLNEAPAGEPVFVLSEDAQAKLAERVDDARSLDEYLQTQP